jgi:hypothetical protein
MSLYIIYKYILDLSVGAAVPSEPLLLRLWIQSLFHGHWFILFIIGLDGCDVWIVASSRALGTAQPAMQPVEAVFSLWTTSSIRVKFSGKKRLIWRDKLKVLQETPTVGDCTQWKDLRHSSSLERKFPCVNAQITVSWEGQYLSLYGGYNINTTLENASTKDIPGGYHGTSGLGERHCVGAHSKKFRINAPFKWGPFEGQH